MRRELIKIPGTLDVTHRMHGRWGQDLQKLVVQLGQADGETHEDIALPLYHLNEPRHQSDSMATLIVLSALLHERYSDSALLQPSLAVLAHMTQAHSSSRLLSNADKSTTCTCSPRVACGSANPVFKAVKYQTRVNN